MEQSLCLIVIRNFAKIGEKNEGETDYIGNFRLGERNNRREISANYLGKENQSNYNGYNAAHIIKQRTKLIIFYPTIKQLVRINLNRFTTGKDSWLMRAKLLVDNERERQKLFWKECYCMCDILNEVEYQDDLHKGLSNFNIKQLEVDELADKITGDIVTSIEEVCLRTQNHKNSKPTLKNIRM